MAKVLYVDDDEPNLIVFEAAFGAELDVLTASSGARALAIAEHEEIGVFLVDQRMPAMSGVELLEAVHERWPEAVRILITAYADLGEAIGAINRGHVRRYVTKPWDHDELRLVLVDALDVYDTRSRLARLEQRVRETERVYALGVIAASLAHELKNPLTILTGTFDVLEMRANAQPLTGPEAKELIASGRMALQRIADITRGIEMGHGKAVDEREADPLEVLRLTLRCIQGPLANRAEIVVDGDGPELPHVRASPTKLGQVLLNLIVNALQAMPEPGAGEKHVWIRLGHDEARFFLEVEDDGPGIPPERVSRIFDPFFTTKDSGGTGLGLAISKRIVEESGGTLRVASEPGRGTRFTVTLPAALEGSDRSAALGSRSG